MTWFNYSETIKTGLCCHHVEEYLAYHQQPLRSPPPWLCKPKAMTKHTIISAMLQYSSVYIIAVKASSHQF